MVDYRKIQNMEQYLKIWELIVECGVEYGFPSTGMYNDDHADTLTLCFKTTEKFPTLNMICNGSIYLRGHYNAIANAGVFGIRFSNINAIQRCIIE